MAGTVAMLLNLFSQELVSWSYLAKNLYLVIIKASESLDYSRFINICKNVSELVVALYRIKTVFFLLFQFSLCVVTSVRTVCAATRCQSSVLSGAERVSRPPQVGITEKVNLCF